jgi:hypothetical protein
MEKLAKITKKKKTVMVAGKSRDLNLRLPGNRVLAIDSV